MSAKNIPRHEMLLRVWIGIVAFMALGNTLQCFFGNPSFLSSKLYNGKPQLMNELTSRLFGMWTLLSCVLRFYCSFSLKNKPIYVVTMISFLLAFLHFSLEIWDFQTCKPELGALTPVLVSSVSVLWMFVGQWFIEFEGTCSTSTHSRSSHRSSASKHK